MYDIPYMWNLKRNDMNLQSRKRLTDLRERTYGCLPTLLYLKWITNKDLEYSTWNAFQHAAAWMGGEFGGECICTAESLCCSPETITTLLISYTPIQNKKLKKIYIYILFMLLYREACIGSEAYTIAGGILIKKKDYKQKFKI